MTEIPPQLLTYLQKTGERQHDVRQNLADSKFPASDRKSILEALDQMAMFFQGFFTAMEFLFEEGQVEYLRQYYNQARSKQGLTFNQINEKPP